MHRESLSSLHAEAGRAFGRMMMKEADLKPKAESSYVSKLHNNQLYLIKGFCYDLALEKHECMLLKEFGFDGELITTTSLISKIFSSLEKRSIVIKESKPEIDIFMPYLIPLAVQIALILKLYQSEASFEKLAEKYDPMSSRFPKERLSLQEINKSSLRLPFMDSFEPPIHTVEDANHKIIQNYGDGVFSVSSQICKEPKNCFCSNKVRIIVGGNPLNGSSCEGELTLPLDSDCKIALHGNSGYFSNIEMTKGKLD